MPAQINYFSLVAELGPVVGIVGSASRSCGERSETSLCAESRGPEWSGVEFLERRGGRAEVGRVM